MCSENVAESQGMYLRDTRLSLTNSISTNSALPVTGLGFCEHVLTALITHKIEVGRQCLQLITQSRMKLAVHS
jgi:hypothetical protein